MADKRKYTIDDQVKRLPREITINKLVAILEKEGISRDTFYRDRKLTINSKTSIPSDRLLKYAKLFECDLNDLVSQTVKTKSIREHVKGKRKVRNGLS